MSRTDRGNFYSGIYKVGKMYFILKCELILKLSNEDQIHPAVCPHHGLTLLSRETARETEVLNSSGFFWASVVMRLVAAVTTP